MSFGVETSDDLLLAIKRDLKIPASQLTYSDPQILSIASEQLVSKLAPVLLSMDEGWYRTQTDTTMTAGTPDYLLPKYAMFQKINTITIVNNVTNEEIPLERAEINDRRYYGYGTTGFPTDCYLDHNSVTLIPAPDSGVTTSYNLRFVYYRMPGKLVKKSEAAQVQSVNYATGAVTYTATPPATFTSSSFHDFYSSTPPFKRLQNNIQATALAANVQTFPVASVQTLLAGNWVNLVDETIYPDIPYGLFTALKELTMFSLSNSQMDIQTAMQIQQQIVLNAKNMIGSAPGNRYVSKYKKISQWDNALLNNIGTSRGRGVFP